MFTQFLSGEYHLVIYTALGLSHHSVSILLPCFLMESAAEHVHAMRSFVVTELIKNPGELIIIYNTGLSLLLNTTFLTIILYILHHRHHNILLRFIARHRLGQKSFRCSCSHGLRIGK